MIGSFPGCGPFHAPGGSDHGRCSIFSLLFYSARGALGQDGVWPLAAGDWSHYTSRLHIERTDKIASAGSCFAQRISETLQSSGYTYFVTEAGPPFLSAERKRELGYRVYSARYGNIYIVLQLLQLFRRAFGRFEPEEPVWQLADGKFVDPFRPSVQPGGFQSEEECMADRASHFAAARCMFEEVDVFAFALGLTESWASTVDGAVFPSCPGSALGGLHDPARHAFHNFSVSEVTKHLDIFIAEF